MKSWEEKFNSEKKIEIKNRLTDMLLMLMNVMGKFLSTEELCFGGGMWKELEQDRRNVVPFEKQVMSLLHRAALNAILPKGISRSREKLFIESLSS